MNLEVKEEDSALETSPAESRGSLPGEIPWEELGAHRREQGVSVQGAVPLTGQSRTALTGQQGQGLQMETFSFLSPREKCERNSLSHWAVWGPPLLLPLWEPP